MEQAIKYLRALRNLSPNGYGAQIVNAVYISPAQSLRNSADEMERKEALLKEIDEFLAKN